MNDLDAQRILEAYDSPKEPYDALDDIHQKNVDKELLQPLHAAANNADGSISIDEWMINQIKDQGDTWVEWFIETVVSKEDDTGRIPHDYVPPHDQDRLNRAKKRGY